MLPFNRPVTSPNGSEYRLSVLSPPTPRQKYLIRLGLRGDPFLLPNAEEELAYSGQTLAQTAPVTSGEGERILTVPPFFHYYVQPFTAPDGRRLLHALRQPGWSLVFGERGSGKSTLRLNLEAEIRRQPGRTLVVSCSFNQDVEPSEAYWSWLAQTLALDLFIQLVEQFNPLNPPTPEQSASWRTILTLGGRPLERLARRFLEALKASEPRGVLGLGDIWASVDRSDVSSRPALIYVERYPQLMDVLSDALHAARGAQALCGRVAFQAGLRMAQLWGYQQIFLLVDNVDARERPVEAMLDLLRPLLQMPPDWQEYNLSGKLFLPLELKPYLSADLLPKSVFDVTIQWDEDGLRALVERRFRAAGARYRGFDDLAGPDLEGQLDRLLIQAAEGSPRRLLETISRLLDAHASRDPEAGDRLIRLADWQQARRHRGNKTPPIIAVTGAEKPHSARGHESHTQAGQAHPSAPPPELKTTA